MTSQVVKLHRQETDRYLFFPSSSSSSSSGFWQPLLGEQRGEGRYFGFAYADDLRREPFKDRVGELKKELKEADKAHPFPDDFDYDVLQKHSSLRNTVASIRIFAEEVYQLQVDRVVREKLEVIKANSHWSHHAKGEKCHGGFTDKGRFMITNETQKDLLDALEIVIKAIVDRAGAGQLRMRDYAPVVSRSSSSVSSSSTSERETSFSSSSPSSPRRNQQHQQQHHHHHQHQQQPRGDRQQQGNSRPQQQQQQQQQQHSHHHQDQRSNSYQPQRRQSEGEVRGTEIPVVRRASQHDQPTSGRPSSSSSSSSSAPPPPAMSSSSSSSSRPVSSSSSFPSSSTPGELKGAPFEEYRDRQQANGSKSKSPEKYASSRPPTQEQQQRQQQEKPKFKSSDLDIFK